MPSINYAKLLNAISTGKVDAETFFRVEYGQISAKKKDLLYFKFKWNVNFEDHKKAPEYAPTWDLHVDEEQCIGFNGIVENKHEAKSDSGKDSTTWYFSKRCSKKTDPVFYNMVEFAENAIRGALRALKADIEQKHGTNPKDMNAETKLVYNIVKQDLDDVFKGYIIRSRVDKVTKKEVALEDPYVSIGFDFNAWNAKLKSLAGKQISRVAFKKTDEELKAGNPDIKYKARKINGDHDRPQSVYKHPAGTFWGDINFPGKMYTNAGEIKVGMTLGFVFVESDVNSGDAKAGGMMNPESLCESYDDDAVSSKLKAASKTLVESEDSNSDDSDEEPAKKTSKSKAKKAKKPKSESDEEESEEEEEKPKKKVNKSKAKKKEPEPEESSESEYDSE